MLSSRRINGCLIECDFLLQDYRLFPELNSATDGADDAQFVPAAFQGWAYVFGLSLEERSLLLYKCLRLIKDSTAWVNLRDDEMISFISSANGFFPGMLGTVNTWYSGLSSYLFTGVAGGPGTGTRLQRVYTWTF